MPAVELDIWITTDNQIVVIHGGTDGQMPLKLGEPADTERKLIYEMTYEEVLEHFKETNYFIDGLEIAR